MSRSCEVSSILANRRKLRDLPSIAIKPDMSPTDRKIEAILLKERYTLIKSGVSKGQIKIRGNAIFVSNAKIGSVVNFEFKQSRDPPSINSNKSDSTSQIQTDSSQSE